LAITQSLLAITSALSRALTPAEAGDVVIQQGLPGIGADAGAVAVLDDSGNYLDMVRTIGYPPEMVHALQRTPLSGLTPMAEAARTRRAVWREPGPASDAAFADYTRVNRNFASGAALPLSVEGRLLGALALSFVGPRVFDAHDRAFATALAAQCALAIERSRLYAAEQRARAAAEAAATQLDVVLRGVVDGIVAQDPSGRLVYANDSAALILGYASAADLIAAPPPERRSAFELVDADDGDFDAARLPTARALRGETVATMPLRFRVRATAEERWALVSATPVTDERGQVTMAISIFRDVTEERAARERLAFLNEATTLLASSLDYELTLSRVAQLVVPRLADACVVDVVTEDGGVRRLPIVLAPGAPEGLMPALEALGPPTLDGPGAAAEVLRTGRAVLVTHVTDDVLVASARDAAHLALLRRVGIRSSALLPLLARGTVLGALTLVTAYSGRSYGAADLRLAAELASRAAQAMDNARLYESMQDAVRARDEFLSIASHELRTPVAAIKSLAQLLQRSLRRGPIAPDRLERSLTQISASSDRLASLTEDLLDVSRLQTGRLELHLQSADLATVISELMETGLAQFDERHTLEVDIVGSCRVALDLVRFEQVVANLVGNALKYSPEGGPVRLVVAPADDGVVLQVADQGIGLPPGQADTVFYPFGRAANARARQIQGMGLGLYICRQIIDRHGGRIWAESEGEGRGTIVNVWLPCDVAARASS
jgi:PAS domain S-box-containing protein